MSDKEFYTSVHRLGDDILYRGYKNGKRISKKIDFEPSLFVSATDEDSGWRTLIGNHPLEEKRFNSMRHAGNWLKKYEDVENFEVHGNTNYLAQFMFDTFPGKIEFDIDDIHIMPIDIEVDAEGGFVPPEEATSRINTIVAWSSRDKLFHVFTVLEYDELKSELKDVIKDNIVFKPCKDERDLFDKFLDFWSSDYPDIVTGWNIDGYDIAYIINRSRFVYPEDPLKIEILSPWGKINHKEVLRFGKEQDNYQMLGVQTLDFKDLFMKFGSYPPQENYKLDTIAHTVLDQKKLSYEEYGNLHQLMLQNPQKYVDYCIQDVNLIKEMEEKINIINLCLTMAYRGAVNYTDTLGTVAIWDSILYRDLASQHIAVPPKRENSSDSYPGGYVKDVVPGLYEWVSSFDLDSLYPNIIVEWNISPETILPNMVPVTGEDVLKGKYTETIDDVIVAANGCTFSRDKQGFIPRIAEEYYADRKKIKGAMLDLKKKSEAEGTQDENEGQILTLKNEQMAIKLLLNSLYGAMANKYFRYYSLAMASAITLNGQMVIKWSEKALNEYLNKMLKTPDEDRVIAMDTDSVYVDLSDIAKKAPYTDTEKLVNLFDDICDKKLNPCLNNAYQNLHKIMNTFIPRMNMKRENIADKAIWTAKKRYIMNVWDSEGVRYSEPDMKIMGIEAIKSSTPEICRDKFKDIFKIIMTGSEINTQDFIKEFKSEFKKLEPHEIAYPRGVNNIEKWTSKSEKYKKGCPINVRASINYNSLINEFTLTDRYSIINSGDKMRYLALKTPNPTHTHVIAFPDVLPKELDLEEYVDYNAQFEGAFIKPLKGILDAIGWSVEPKDDIMSFFS